MRMNLRKKKTKNHHHNNNNWQTDWLTTHSVRCWVSVIDNKKFLFHLDKYTYELNVYKEAPLGSFFLVSKII